jgi:hypothetical protein
MKQQGKMVACSMREGEIMGMTDVQFKDHLRELIAFLEHVEKLETVEEIRAELEQFIERKQKTLED